MIRAYRAWAESLCAPVFWRMANGRMNNGTVTFLKTKDAVLGITNAHVVDGLVNSDERGWQLGNAQFDPNRIIARHPSLDLATFQLSNVFLTTAGKNAATVPHWPPKSPAFGDPITLGGYPGQNRTALAGIVTFDVAWFAGKVKVEGESTTGVVLDISESIATTRRRIPAHANLGGCSGGPVFRVVEAAGIERLELCAIICQYSQASEIMLACTLTDLREDGTFVG